MIESIVAQPKIVSREEWLSARKELLAKEKELTRRRDALNAERRRLPMVAIEKQYVFSGPDGQMSLLDLFDNCRQLIVYHFMFEPGPAPPGKSGEPWDEGCSGCSFVTDNIGHLAHLRARDTSLVLVSRAPITKIAPFKARMGWTVPWYSSFGSDFNYDFHVTQDEAIAPIEYNYRDKQTLRESGHNYHLQGEQPGLSVFLRDGDKIFHTYSMYARGLDQLDGTYIYLDLTPFGRQEKWEDSPGGWPQTPTDWLRHHDKYGEERGVEDSCCNAKGK
ncbi:MAG TPA: DUF899 domain-containing protein [Bryobacteraceae bacterium]|nr:DUF899 domain-containing protein [Bryobacteraceae bacterium]